MKNRRFTYIYILLAALLLAASYQFNYRDSKEAVQARINEQFKEAVPHWGDSMNVNAPIREVLAAWMRCDENYDENRT